MGDEIQNVSITEKNILATPTAYKLLKWIKSYLMKAKTDIVIVAPDIAAPLDCQWSLNTLDYVSKYWFI